MADLERFLDVFGARCNLQPRYNIRSTTAINVVVADRGERKLRKMRWGLIPLWWRGPLKSIPAAFNADAKTVATKPMFRSAYKYRRCIIPASGFYEWTGPRTDRQPHYFAAADGSILAFAGLWERWRAPDTAEDILSCTILVTEANDPMRRDGDPAPAPVMLRPDEYDGWLAGGLEPRIVDQPPIELIDRPVSKRINVSGVDDDDPTLIEPVHGHQYPLN